MSATDLLIILAGCAISWRVADIISEMKQKSHRLKVEKTIREGIAKHYVIFELEDIIWEDDHHVRVNIVRKEEP